MHLQFFCCLRAGTNSRRITYNVYNVIMNRINEKENGFRIREENSKTLQYMMLMMMMMMMMTIKMMMVDGRYCFTSLSTMHFSLNAARNSLLFANICKGSFSCRCAIDSSPQCRTCIYSDQANPLMEIQRRVEPATSRLGARHRSH